MGWGGEHSIQDKQLSALCALGCLKNGDGTQYLQSVNVYFYQNTKRRRKWQPIPVFFPGEFYGWRSQADCSPWGCKESETTEQLTHTHTRQMCFNYWKRVKHYLCVFLKCRLYARQTWCLPSWSFGFSSIFTVNKRTVASSIIPSVKLGSGGHSQD